MSEKINLPILYEDADVVVINKPAGLLVHRSDEEAEQTSVADILVAQYPSMKSVGDAPDVRPGIVHRLDKEASGVLVVAKTQAAFEHLKEQFKSRQVEKVYDVLVYGKVIKDFGEIRLRIERSKRTGRMATRPKDADEGREAHTEYDVVRRFAKATLLRVQIHTGRTHQIRTHFFAMGHPVVGDALYTRTMRKIRPIEGARLFLHAHTLSLTLPSQNKKTFEAPLPEDLEIVLRGLK